MKDDEQIVIGIDDQLTQIAATVSARLPEHIRHELTTMAERVRKALSTRPGVGLISRDFGLAREAVEDAIDVLAGDLMPGSPAAQDATFRHALTTIASLLMALNKTLLHQQIAYLPVGSRRPHQRIVPDAPERVARASATLERQSTVYAEVYSSLSLCRVSLRALTSSRRRVLQAALGDGENPFAYRLQTLQATLALHSACLSEINTTTARYAHQALKPIIIWAEECLHSGIPQDEAGLDYQISLLDLRLQQCTERLSARFSALSTVGKRLKQAVARYAGLEITETPEV